jgi:membrane-bound ClpP family serine protease
LEEKKMTWFILLSLLLIGLILILAEIIFVPGTTLVGLIGLIVTIAGIYYAFISLEYATAWTVLAMTAVVNLGAVVYGFRSGVWSRFALKEAVTATTFEDRLKGLSIGMEGKAISDLKPIGKADFLDKAYEVKSNSGFIPVGTKVIITKLENNTIIVKS